ncbi:unnamed protein product, partial [Heterosigma akashiwo]
RHSEAELDSGGGGDGRQEPKNRTRESPAVTRPKSYATAVVPNYGTSEDNMSTKDLLSSLLQVSSSPAKDGPGGGGGPMILTAPPPRMPPARPPP